MGFYAAGIYFAFDFWFFAVVSLFAALSPAWIASYLFLPVLIHELGHLIAIFAVGAKIKTVRFTAFGIQIEKARNHRHSITREVIICLGGILANLAVAAAFFMLSFKSMRIMLFISSNTAVALFNLLPIGSLDGGEVARILSEYFFKPRLAFILSRVFSFAALTPVFAAAAFLIMRPERNFTLLAVCGYLFAEVLAEN